MFCDESNIDYEIDYEAENENIYNWYTKVRLMCKPTRATALIAMAAFFGVFIGCLFIPRIGDLYGRKPIYLASMIVQSPIIIILIINTNMPVMYTLVAVFGMSIIGRMSCGFLLLMEHVPRKM